MDYNQTLITTNNQESIHNRNQANQNKKAIVTKSVIFFSFLLFVGFNTNVGFLNSNLNTNCIYDLGLNIFEPINKFFHSNARDYLLIFSSFLIDFTAITTLGLWVYSARTWSFPIYTVIFYSTRALVQQIYQMPFPIRFNFFYPGFPSICVPYAHTNDFFWSGHVALPLLCGFELKAQGHSILFYFTIFVSFLESFVMLSVSGHYSIDLIIGVIISLWLIKNIIELVESFGNSFLIMKDYNSRI
jgi:hypothetical protein